MSSLLRSEGEVDPRQRRLGGRLASGPPLCLPTSAPDSTSAGTSQDERCQDAPDCARLWVPVIIPLLYNKVFHELPQDLALRVWPVSANV